MKKTFFVFTFYRYFLFITHIQTRIPQSNLAKKANAKFLSNKQIMMFSKIIFRTVKCTSELKYPEPIYGYDDKRDLNKNIVFLIRLLDTQDLLEKRTDYIVQ